MNHPPYVHRHTISHDFLTFGNAGIGLNRAAERLDRDRADQHVALILNPSGPFRSFRHLVGNLLIAAGTGLSGAVPGPALDTSDPRTA